MGLNLKGNVVLGTVLGGPAWASEFFAAGDVIIAVNNKFVPDETLLEVLESCDVAESIVTITVQKGGAKVSLSHTTTWP